MSRLFQLARLTLGVLMSVVLLSACSSTDDLNEPPVPLGRFLLGHNIAIVASDAQSGPLSRTLENDVIVASVRKAINDRFSRYDGDQYYHLSVVVLGYVLAQPGIPLVASPKSALIANVSVYDDRSGGKPINEEPKQFTVLETAGDPADVLFGTGYTRSPEEQLDNMAAGLSAQIQKWLVVNKDWFGDASLMDPATTSSERPVQPLPQAPGTGGSAADAADGEDADNSATTDAPEA